MGRPAPDIHACIKGLPSLGRGRINLAFPAAYNIRPALQASTFLEFPEDRVDRPLGWDAKVPGQFRHPPDNPVSMHRIFADAPENEYLNFAPLD